MKNGLFTITFYILHITFLLWAPTKQPDDKFWKALLAIKRIKDSNWTKTSRISESESYRVSSGKYAASCVFDYLTKIVRSWLGCVPHPYSPNIATSDFHLFRSLQNSLDGWNFNFLVDIKNHIEKIFVEIPEKFGGMGYLSCAKDGEGLWNKMALI